MLTDFRTSVERAARELLSSFADLQNPPTLRVAEVEGRAACLILVWDVAQGMPTVGAERRRRSGGGRVECKRDVVEAVRIAARALTRKEVVKALRKSGKNHGAGTIAKALADLTAAGELVNPKDKKGYRLSSWKKEKTPSLFE